MQESPRLDDAKRSSSGSLHSSLSSHTRRKIKKVKKTKTKKEPGSVYSSQISQISQIASAIPEEKCIPVVPEPVEEHAAPQQPISTPQVKTTPRVYKQLHYTNTPNRFGTLSLVDKNQQLRSSRLNKVDTQKYNPHSSQNDILTKIMYSIEQEEKRQQDLKNRILMLNSIDREVELYDKEQELKKQLQDIKKQILDLTIKFKQNDYKSNQIISTQLNNNSNVERIRSDIRALNKQFLAKRDKINELNKQLEVIQQRVQKFQSLVPLLHDKLETGCEVTDFDSLVGYFKELVTKEEGSRPKQELINSQYKAQQDEIDKLVQMSQQVKKVLENQQKVNMREEDKLNKEIENMERKKDEMVQEYEKLYEKYQSVMADD